jgi:hypothetical protein
VGLAERNVASVSRMTRSEPLAALNVSGLLTVSKHLLRHWLQARGQLSPNVSCDEPKGLERSQNPTMIDSEQICEICCCAAQALCQLKLSLG